MNRASSLRWLERRGRVAARHARTAGRSRISGGLVPTLPLSELVAASPRHHHARAFLGGLLHIPISLLSCGEIFDSIGPITALASVACRQPSLAPRGYGK